MPIVPSVRYLFLVHEEKPIRTLENPALHACMHLPPKVPAPTVLWLHAGMGRDRREIDPYDGLPCHELVPKEQVMQASPQLVAVTVVCELADTLKKKRPLQWPYSYFPACYLHEENGPSNPWQERT